MIRHLFLKMDFPQIFSAMTGTLCMLIDGIIIGQFLGVNCMSAFGLTAPVLIAFSSLGLMLSSGVQVVCGKAMGSRDLDEGGRCYSSSVILSIVTGAAVILLIFTALVPICRLLGAGSPGDGNEIFQLTADFLKGTTLGVPFLLLIQVLTPFLQAFGKRRLVYCSVAVMILSNSVFDFLCVTFWKSGMFGIGISSALSYFSAFLVCGIFFLKKDCSFQMSAKGIRPGAVWEILKAGSPVIIAQLFYVACVYCFNRLLLGISGTQAVAAYSTVSTLGDILYSIGLGGGEVALLLSSLFYKEKDRSSLKELVRVMSLYTFILAASVVLVFEAGAPWIIRMFYKPGTEVYHFAINGLYLYSLSMILSCLNTVYKNYYQGIQHTHLTNLISFLESFALTTLGALILSRFFGMTGFWTGIILGQIGTVLVVSIFAWRKAGRISFSPETYCRLDPDFGVDPAHIWEYNIANKDTAMAASMEVFDFCKKNGLDPNTCMLISLCVEEISMNVVDYGFDEKQGVNPLKTRHLDTSVIIEENRKLICFRDDCNSFDPTKYLELNQDSDPFTHIGIRMILGKVKEANYVNSFGLNILTLVL